MEIAAYQQAAARTVQPLHRDGAELAVALLGMVGEAGAVATAYKKQLRDGASDPGFKARMREELGDVLWYVSALATHLDLNLDDVATANVAKIADRWRPTPTSEIPFDDGFPEREMLPRTADFVFTLTEGQDGRQTSVLTCGGQQVGARSPTRRTSQTDTASTTFFTSHTRRSSAGHR